MGQVLDAIQGAGHIHESDGENWREQGSICCRQLAPLIRTSQSLAAWHIGSVAQMPPPSVVAS